MIPRVQSFGSLAIFTRVHKSPLYAVVPVNEIQASVKIR